MAEPGATTKTQQVWRVLPAPECSDQRSASSPTRFACDINQDTSGGSSCTDDSEDGVFSDVTGLSSYIGVELVEQLMQGAEDEPEAQTTSKTPSTP